MLPPSLIGFRILLASGILFGKVTISTTVTGFSDVAHYVTKLCDYNLLCTYFEKMNLFLFIFSPWSS